jgi:hypothetical protein
MDMHVNISPHLVYFNLHIYIILDIIFYYKKQMLFIYINTSLKINYNNVFETL